MPFYRNILRQAWELTWKNKYLWWFGIFAALLGNGGELEILFNDSSGDPGHTLFPAWQGIASTGVFRWQTITNIGNLLKNDTLNMILVLLICLVALAIFLFLVWLVMVSQAALVNNSEAIIKRKKNNFRNGLDAGVLKFWPVFGLNFLVKASIYALLAIVTLPVVYFGESFSVAYVIALIVMVPVAIILSFITKYAIAYSVLNNAKAGQAVSQGMRLFKENWLISFEMAIILFVINILTGLAIVLAILTLAVPFLFLILIFYYTLALAGFAWLIMGLALAGFLFIVITGGAALSVFQTASWTSLFLELNKKKGESKLVRIVNSMVGTG